MATAGALRLGHASFFLSGHRFRPPLSSFTTGRKRAAPARASAHLHDLFVGVGVGLPCTVMECGDIIYRSTLPRPTGLTLTAPGVALAFAAVSYLWATPGVAPGFFDMFVLAFVERFFRPAINKDDIVLGKKLGEGAFGVVYKVSLANPKPSIKMREVGCATGTATDTEQHDRRHGTAQSPARHGTKVGTSRHCTSASMERQGTARHCTTAGTSRHCTSAGTERDGTARRDTARPPTLLGTTDGAAGGTARHDSRNITARHGTARPPARHDTTARTSRYCTSAGTERDGTAQCDTARPPTRLGTTDGAAGGTALQQHRPPARNGTAAGTARHGTTAATSRHDTVMHARRHGTAHRGMVRYGTAAGKARQ